MSSNNRHESDSMGEVELPADAYWGAQSARAAENFDVSQFTIPGPLLVALARLKESAASVNESLGLIEPRIGAAIRAAADEVAEGRWSDHFPVDVFQTGSGTSWNMNVNEVIANVANVSLGSALGTRAPVHPNDHVNKGQSSNDVVPTAIAMSTRTEAKALAGELDRIAEALSEKSREFVNVVKLGRTHLQDAVPMTLGDEFGAYAEQMRKGGDRVRRCFGTLAEVPLGGTAVGTGINTHPEFARRVMERISERTGIEFQLCASAFEGISARDAQVEFMGALNTVAVSLMKIGQDLRLLASGPRAALGEITLRALQPGSSIMPGKVNPVIPEMVIQVAAHLMGKHLTVTIAGQNAPLELNIMQPLIAYETLSAIELLSNTLRVFRLRCIDGIEANEERCRTLIDGSLALVTPLAIRVGYDRAAAIAHRAFAEGRTVKEIVVDEKLLTEAEADDVLNPESMLGR